MKLDYPCNKFEIFHYPSLERLRSRIDELELDFPISKDIDLLKEPLQVGEFILPNRLTIQPMEGFDARGDGSPSALTHKRYLKYAKGGAALIWMEATAISQECKSNAHQLILSEKTKRDFKSLVEKIKKESQKSFKSLGFEGEAKVILQLNHSGRYTKRNGKRYPIKAYQSKKLDNAIGVTQTDGEIISDERLENLEELWIKKALLSKEAGFDGVDIKACHGYLISELLSARTRKDSKYGGESFKDRTRFYLNVLEKLRDQLSKQSNFVVTSRIGIYDGNPYPNGFGVAKIEEDSYPATLDLTEPLELLRKVADMGIKLVNISAGNPHFKPHITRPYDIPIKSGKRPNEHPLCSVHRLIDMTRKIKEGLSSDIKVIGSGYSYLREFCGYLCAGLLENTVVDLCGLGRMAFAHPNFPKEIFTKGKLSKNKTCITCSRCSELMRLGKSTGCTIRDPYYQKLYKKVKRKEKKNRN